ncbi:MAG: PKD domain-containing protein [Ferruginibacter sp.]
MKYLLSVLYLIFFYLAVNGQSINANGSTSFCGSGSVQLSVVNPPPGATYQWLKNNAAIGGATGINYIANTAGTYTAIIKNVNPPDTLNNIVVTFNPVPTADFAFTPNTTVCSGTPIQFTSTVTGGTAPFTYTWDFGGNGTATTANPIHPFTSLGCGTGTFAVKLTVTDSKGCSTVITHNVNVLQAPDVQLADQNVFSAFSNCSNSPTAANPNYTLTVNNISPSASCITTYNINWGDGNSQNGVSFPLTHMYTQLGAFNLVVTALGSNGCSYSKTYVIANQSNPAGSLGTLGSTTNLCVPAVVPFTISNWQINSPGTSYVLDFGDGTSVTLNQPLNPGMTTHTVNHNYTTSSCPFPSYTAVLSVINACDNTPYTAGNIQIRIKPTADFDIVKSPSCVGQSVCFNNTTTAGSYGPNCSTLATYIWDFGDGSPLSNQQSPCHTYTAAGTYNVSLSSTNPCGTTTISKQVCITVPPDPAFTLSTNSGCKPLLVTTINTTNTFGSCQNPTYKWRVKYTPAFCGIVDGSSFVGGTSSTSTNPSFQFTSSGTYDIFLDVTNACGTFTTSQTINVKQPPTVKITPPVYPCGPVTINPSATVTSCGTQTPLTYLWTFAGGSITTSTSANPGPISFSAVGNHTIALAVTNECGTTIDNTSILVTNAPDIVATTDKKYCGGVVTAPINFSSTIGTPVYHWTNSNPSIGLAASGTGNIPSFTTINNGANPVVATIIVTPYVNPQCSGVSDTFLINVNPRPAVPVTIQSLIYCLNTSASPLSPTAATGDTLYWYNNSNLTGGGTTAPTPATNIPTTLQYFVTQKNSFGCESVASNISVSINPAISGDSIATSQNICANTIPSTLNTVNIIGGGNGSFTYQWQSSIDAGVTWVNTTVGTGATYSPPALTATTLYRRIVNSSTCTDTSNVVTITVQGALTNYNITAAQIVCAGSVPDTLRGGLPTGGGGAYMYTWESSIDNTTWNNTGGAGFNYLPAALQQTTYFRRKVAASQCSAVSNVVVITVKPLPIGQITAPIKSICTTDQGNILFSATTGIAPFNIEILLKRPVGVDTTLIRTVNTKGPSSINVITPNSAPGRYIISLAKITDSNTCVSLANLVSKDTIDIFTPVINVIKNDTIICSSQQVLLQTQALSGGSTAIFNPIYTYQWESTPMGQTNWQSMPGDTLANLSVSPVISTCYRRKVKSNNLCEVVSNAVCITVNAAITNNTVSASHQVCINITPSMLNGATPSGGDGNYVYQWQSSTDSISWNNIATTLSYQPGTYTVAGINYFRRNVISGGCASISNVITVTVRPDAKAIFTANATTVCSATDLGNFITVNALPNNNGLYQWYADGILFGSNSTGVFPNYSIANPDDTVIVKLVTTSPYGCLPDSIQQQFITIKTSIAGFTKDTSFGCGPLPVTFINTSSIINGINFFWDFGNGKTSQLAQPGGINFLSSPDFNDTTYQISLKAYNGCDTTVWLDSVKVRSNPKARFGVDTTFGCSPFTLQINNTSPGGPNTYYWDFGDGKKDTTTINGIMMHLYNTGSMVDTITVQLISENQCGRDTQALNVRIAPNIIKPLINVNSSQLFGCTPHIVTFNNNSSGATGLTWNFGDGSPAVITNNNQSTVTHQYNTAGTFTISIDITNGCSDTTVYRQVTVYPKPVADFSTDANSYCSGDTVRVTNNSTNATNYKWFWDDGTGSSLTAPTHVYTVGGSYNILLRAERTNAAGLVCVDTFVRPITVLVQPDVRVQSNIGAINCAPYTFNGIVPGITNETVGWYIYDSTKTPAITLIQGNSANYTFNKPGTFSIKFLAANSIGCSDSTVFAFTVKGTASASFTPGDLAVCARDTTINFINTSTYNGTGPVSFQWLVNNVLSATSGNFTHRFTVAPNAALPYTFTTSLVVANSVGCSDTTTSIVQINPTAKAAFVVSNPNNCVPFVPTISNASLYGSSYKWLLNGVLVDTAAIPTMLITKGSTLYTISLIADNIYGCKPDTFKVSFTSRARPVAAFTLSDTLGCTGSLNVVTNNITTGASSYVWNWGDGTGNSFSKNPTHLFTITGQYLINVVASDGVCTDTAEHVVKVSKAPLVDFAADQTITCDTARIQFTSLTTNGATYLWSFGDGTFSTDENPFHSFVPRSALYTVKLVAFNNFGCKDSLTKANYILAKVPPAGDFNISPSPTISIPQYTFSFNNLTTDRPNYSYLWNLGDGTSATTRDVLQHKYNDTGSYPIQLVVFDNISGCPDTTIKIARIIGSPGHLYVPNAFYPNSLQVQFRSFKPIGKGLEKYSFQVFDSWGKLLFETTELDAAGSPVKGWDGTFKGRPMPQDAYAWRIKATFRNGRQWDGMSYNNSLEGAPGNTFGTVTLFR